MKILLTLKERLIKDWFILLVFSITATILIYNLDHRYLWNDEAYTAMHAKSTLKNGYPLVYDGNTFHTGTNGNDFNTNFQFVLYPWLQMYLIAGSFKLFGVNHGAARIPSVLFGLISLIAFYYLSLRLSKNDKVTTRISTLIYGFSLPFLSSARYCKYFALVLAFSILAMLFYVKFLKSHKRKDIFLFAASIILLFHSNYISFLGILFSISLYHLIFIRTALKKMALSYLIIFLFTAPWIVFIELHFSNCYRGFFLGWIDGIDLFIARTITSFYQINTQYFPFISLIIVFLIAITFVKIFPGYFNMLKVKNINIINRSILWLQAEIIISTILIYNIFIPLGLDWWFISIFPSGCILTAFIIRYLYSLHKVYAIIVLIILCLSNALHILPYKVIDYLNINPYNITSIVKPPIKANGFEPPTLYGYVKYECNYSLILIDFIKSLTKDYESAGEGIIKYFKKEGKPKAVVQASFLDHYISFYTGYSIANNLAPGDAYGPTSALVFSGYPNAEKFMKLAYKPYDEIDYFIVMPKSDIPVFFSDYLEKNQSKFQKIYINYPDIFDSYCFIESPKEYTGFYVYKRIK